MSLKSVKKKLKENEIYFGSKEWVDILYELNSLKFKERCMVSDKNYIVLTFEHIYHQGTLDLFIIPGTNLIAKVI